MVDKNRYFYEFQAALDKACVEPKVRKHRVELVNLFQQNWASACERMTGAEFLKECMQIVCIEKPKGRKK